MSNTLPNDSAYPNIKDRHTSPEGGLTKREYFAAMAMQGLLAGKYANDSEEDVKNAIKCADELIKQLNATS